MRQVALTIALMLVGPAGAQTLYECASSAGHSYQQMPCPPKFKTLRVIETAPEPPPTAEQRRERAQKAAEDRAESAFLSHMAGTDQVAVTRRTATYASRSSRSPFRQTSAVDPCNAAKAARASALQAMGLDRTFDRLSALDRTVAEACRR